MPSRMRRRITTAKREEIEAEQKILENTIVRPFETLEGLPISYNEPPNGHYEDILKNPLTIKDSAVLYNSLIRSRSTYVYHAPMFKLHWVKQTAYAKKLAEMDKEKQKEILNDRENKRRFAKATTNSLEARTRMPVLSPEVNARDVMSKLCESSITLGPHRMDIRIFIAKDSRSEKSRAISEISKVGRPKDTETTKDSVSASNKTVDDSQSIESPTSTVPIATPFKAAKEPKQPAIESNPPEQKDSVNMVVTADTECQNPANSTNMRDAEDSVPIEGNDTVKNKGNDEFDLPRTTIPVSKGATPRDKDCLSNTSKELNLSKNEKTSNSKENIANDRSLSGEIIVSNDQSKPKTPEDKPICDTDAITPTCSSAMSPRSLLANPSTNSKSSNDSDKIPKPPVTLTPLPTLPAPSISPSLPVSDSGPDDVHQKVGSITSVPPAPKVSPKPTTSSAPRPSPTNLQSIDNTIMISNLNAIAKIDLSLNDLMKEVASGKASEVQISRFKKYIERAKQMGPQPHHAELYFSRGLPLPSNFPRPYQARPVVEKKPLPKPKVFNPMKLTAFQERYLHDATLVFEFLENPNVRYIIPQDSICEVLKPELPVPIDAEAGTEFNDILLSHVWIHNIDEVEQYEREYSLYESEVKKREEEEEKKLKEEGCEENPKNDNSLIGGDSASKSEPRALRTKKKGPPPKKKKPISPPGPPHIKYTAFSFTIHNIPSRFIPIFQNSMKPLKQVQERMEHILKTGTRMSSFYLWYQVDARLDEAFAENLRNTAVAEEKKMTGFVPPIEAKKRKPRDNKNPRVKRLKEKSPVVDNESLNPISQSQNSAPTPSNPELRKDLGDFQNKIPDTSAPESVSAEL